MLSLIAIIYGAIVALVQPDLKRLVAYSSVSHMGFVTLGIFVFTEQGLQGAILQMINHGLITGALFLLSGSSTNGPTTGRSTKMSGLAARTLVYAALFGFFVFASAGLPGCPGFVGEFLVLVGTFVASPAAAAVATFVMILAAGYLLYMYNRLIFGEVSAFLESLGDHLTDIEPVEILTLVPLATLVVVFGIQPGLLLDLINGTGRRHAPIRGRRHRLRGAAGARRDHRRARPSSASSRGSPGSCGRAVGRRRRRPRRRRRCSTPGRRSERPRPRHDRAAHPRGANGCGHPARRSRVPGPSTLALATAFLGLAITALVVVGVGSSPATAFDGSYTVDALTTFLDLLFIAVVVMTILFAPDYLLPRNLPIAEFAIVLTFAMSGAMLLAGPPTCCCSSSGSS